MDVAALVSLVHGRALRLLCARLQSHFQGLSAAARAARRANLIDSKLQKKLVQLDVTFAFCRHVSEPLVSDFLGMLEDSMKSRGEQLEADRPSRFAHVLHLRFRFSPKRFG